jgi:hypothetical protein
MESRAERPTDTTDHDRKLFAAAALTGLLIGRMAGAGHEDSFAREAWALADAMLKCQPPAPDK